MGIRRLEAKRSCPPTGWDLSYVRVNTARFHAWQETIDHGLDLFNHLSYSEDVAIFNISISRDIFDSNIAPKTKSS
jgi:hypothetical protein